MIDLEKQKKHFTNHKAEFFDYGNIKILDFKNPSSSHYRIRFMFEEDYCKLHISGDLGELIATNYNNMTFEKFSDFVNNVGYFRGKINCLSRDIFYYDEYKARNDLKELIEEYEIEEKLMLDRYDFETIDDVIDDILIDFSEETGIGSKGYDELSKGFYDAYDVWEVASNAGKESTGILDLYMLAFKLAMEQLNDK
ncbi:MAG: hypothetical protein ACLSVX_01200 [Massilimicrobiota timonensis]